MQESLKKNFIFKKFVFNLYYIIKKLIMKLLLFSDLDGTFMNHDDYSFESLNNISNNENINYI